MESKRKKVYKRRTPRTLKNDIKTFKLKLERLDLTKCIFPHDFGKNTNTPSRNAFMWYDRKRVRLAEIIYKTTYPKKNLDGLYVTRICETPNCINPLHAILKKKTRKRI